MQFNEFYTLVHGRAPRAWQSDIAEKLLEHDSWFDGVLAQTGAGKTSVIDIAIWHLAYQVMNGIPRTAPLRIVLGVERKLIVDEAARHTKKIAEAIDTKPELSAVRKALRSLLPDYLGDDEPTIKLTSMHGDTSREHTWWRPVGCSVITGTMTQIVSRVLYRGVGESAGQRSLSAAVLGQDAVRFLDEPHLMTHAVHALREQGKLVQFKAPHTVVLGATVPESMRSGDVYTAHTPESQRWRPLDIVTLPGAVESALAKEIAQQAIKHHHRDDMGEVVVIVSTTKLAKEVQKNISKKKIDTLLVTSHVRGYDRKNIGALPKKDKIVIATQTLEVGVDYDAYTIISDLAPLPSLIQRAGRAGRHDAKRDARVVVVTSDKPLKGQEAVYGVKPLGATLKVLNSDIESFDDITITDAQYDDTWVPESRKVTLDDKMADLLFDVRSPAPWEAYLRGPEYRESASVSILWRDQPELIGDVPASALEKIDLPLYSFLLALTGKSTEISDVDGVLETTGLGHLSVEGAYRVIQSGRTSVELIDKDNYRNIKPGDTIVLPTSAGMYSPETGFDTKQSSLVNDLSVETRKESELSYKDIFVPAHRIVSREVWDKYLNGDIDLEDVDIPEKYSPTDNSNLLVVNKEITQSSSNKKVLLADHLHQVGLFAEKTAEKSGTHVNPEVFYQAGIHHDLGKRVEGFQRGTLGNLTGGEPWAKSCSQSMRLPKTLPVGWRHESVVAKQLYDAGYEIESFIVADHHGHGYIHDMDGELYQVSSTLDGYSPWDMSALSAIFRYADWVASAEPKKYGLKLEELELLVEANDDKLNRRKVDGQTVELTGLDTSRLSDSYAAIGVYAQVLKKDKSALLRFNSEHPEIYTSITIDESLWEPIVRDTVIGHYNVIFYGGDFPEYLTQDYWPVGEKTANNETLRKPQKLSTALLPNNSSTKFGYVNSIDISPIFQMASGYKNEFRVNSFDEGSIIEKEILVKTGGMDDNYEPTSLKSFATVPRPDVLAWVALGQASLGSPQSEFGAGTFDNTLCLPEYRHWMSFDEIKTSARRGYGIQYLRRKKVNEASCKAYCWDVTG